MLMQKTRIRTYKQMTKREILADSLLLLTALIWGCAFAVVKNALDSFPPGAIIAMRYLIAAAITGILFRRHLKELTRGDVARGALVGLLLFGAYIVQTTGLQYTTAGKNAFLTTVYVLLTSVIFAAERAFTAINLLTQGGPSYSTTNLSYVIYEFAFKYYNIGTASAIAVFTSIIFLVITIIMMRSMGGFGYHDQK